MMRYSRNVHDPVYPTYSPYLTTESQIQSLKSMLAQGGAENKEMRARIDKAEARIENMLAEDNRNDAEIRALENKNSDRNRLRTDITAQLADAREDLAALADDKWHLKENIFSLTEQLAQANNSLTRKDAHIASLEAQGRTKTGSNGGTHTRHATSGTQVNRCLAAPDGKGNCNHQNEIARLNSKLTKVDHAQEHSAHQLEKMKKWLEVKEQDIMTLIGKLADQPFGSGPMGRRLGPKQSQHFQYVAVADALVHNKPSYGHTAPRTRAEDYPTDGSSNINASRSTHKSNGKSVRFALD
ncbi:hypothetical protein LPJ66_005237 [Kickxella alabastrina]|uniref:Uncharacterized protein n=1 Tax=Kickxella alabastrina TaxID=61397 RepID=A0ACC1IHG5_9FUNG|nr:hypothetical protein LPJ66_005237 [Kickxella alabastrina]